MLKTHYFVCLSFLFIFTDRARCETDYAFNLKAGGWLKLYSTPETWEEAFSRCHKDGAVLASPLNKDLSNALQLHMAQFGVNGNIFLGTHRLFDKGFSTSVEGVPLSDMDIKWGDEANTGDCLTMSVNGSAYYSSCKDPLPFICYKKPVNQTINECGTFDNEYHLNQQTGSCYKIHLDKLDWNLAYSICESEGAHLVVLNDEEEARIVKDMFPPPPSDVYPWDGFHIGLVALGKEPIWITIHGERIDNVFNKWYPGQPDNTHTQVRGLYLWNGNLDNVDKNWPQMFACEKSPKLEKYEDKSECNVKFNA